MTTRKEIINALITMLEADENTKDVEWHKGEPPRARQNKFPYGWVEFVGGTIDPRTAINEKHKPLVHIVVNDSHVGEDKAEDSVMDYAEYVEAVIKADRTLDGKASTCWFIFDEKAKLFEEDRSVAGIRLTLKIVYIK